MRNAGYEVFLPTYVTLRQWSDRKKKVEFPLIPGVVFVKNNLDNISELFAFQYVLKILREKDNYAIVRQIEIDNLEIIAKEWNNESIIRGEKKNLIKGDMVKIERGNFKGLIGQLKSFNGNHRVIVELEAFNLTFSISISNSSIERI